MPPEAASDDSSYTARLEALTGARWKRLIGAQIPYRLHIRRLVEGEVLDVGCGIGRNLEHLGGRGVGVDINPHSVEAARRRGLEAYTSADFPDSPAARRRYDTLLFAHVLEHMNLEEATELVTFYLGYLKTEGRVVVIVPQAAGFRSDPTHIAPVGAEEIAHLARVTGLTVERIYSFPAPAWVGRFFVHNETVALLRTPGHQG
ncbi:MAG: class I SAM-dependent methyltransferase [Acidimicrobiia bacterium]